MEEFYNQYRKESSNEKLTELLEKYDDIFKEKLPHAAPTKRTVVHHIPLERNAKPLQMYQYRLSPEHCRIIQEGVQELLDLGHIETSTSAWRSPVLVVVKKDGKPRWVVDPRGLNNLTKDCSYPMQFTQQLLETMASGKIWSTLDLTSGYHQVRLATEDREKTAFAIPGIKGGLYQWKVMPFGLKGAPATFQRLMDMVFRPVIGEFAVVYIDDIRVYSQTEEEHLQHLETIFQIMRENEIYARKIKCYFMQDRVPYLGHIISTKGIEMNPAKIEAVTNWPSPTTVKLVRILLGATGYYRHFIEKYAEITKELTKLLKKDVKFEWTDKCEEAKN